MLRTAGILVLGIGLFASGGTAWAQPTAIQIIAAARPPYVLEQDGIGAGPAVELVQHLARATGIDPTVRVVPFQRAVMALDQGGSLYPALLRTPPRESRYIWIGEVYADRAVFFTRSSSPPISNLDTASRLPRISVMRGSELQVMLQSFGLENFETSNSETDNARLLRAGRIDSWFTLRAIGRATWAELGFGPDELRAGESFAVLPFWIAGSPDLPQPLVSKLRATYQAMRADGRYRRIVAPLAEPRS
ncbi:transporter substrate-binding domain-containing protein [Ferrovibrio terrae]|uniref:substrate-binding periplasmic protein n=1 Tax=Ferrovibrio terrae TaxID=2594003 RepID=UPI0031384631